MVNAGAIIVQLVVYILQMPVGWNEVLQLYVSNMYQNTAETPVPRTGKRS